MKILELTEAELEALVNLFDRLDKEEQDKNMIGDCAMHPLDYAKLKITKLFRE